METITIRTLLSLVLLACLLAPGARAQATADQLNKLSLESLTATPPRGSGSGYAPARRYPAPLGYHPAPRQYGAPRYAPRHAVPYRARRAPYTAHRYAPPRRGYHPAPVHRPVYRR